MCIVQVNGSLVVSCAVTLLNEMLIHTNNKRVRQARENVLELILINHPLDCPICDQGGECDLQDITLVYGTDRGRFHEQKKRSVINLYCSSIIKTIMTRCIHCTRCVRFLIEIGLNYTLGVLGRGSFMEINTYINSMLFFELASNIIDLCPVGALTSASYAFIARPWELIKYYSIDILDSIGSAIRLDVYEDKVVRIVPTLDEDVNEDWITDKARFIYDSFSINRLIYPLVRFSFKLLAISW